MGERVGEWAGIPMPIDGEKLVIEPSYAFASILKKPEKETGVTVINSWRNLRYGADIVIYEKDGKRGWTWEPAFHSLKYAMQTMGCAVAWGIEQEAAALKTLGTLVRHHAMKTYLLTGMFIETSKRSGLIYMFRKLKPTVVLTPHTEHGNIDILCALCLHPIAFYAGSWAGAMTPTDDVISHLMLMRGDEHMFWKRSNQHPASRPEAGL